MTYHKNIRLLSIVGNVQECWKRPLPSMSISISMDEGVARHYVYWTMDEAAHEKRTKTTA